MAASRKMHLAAFPGVGSTPSYVGVGCHLAAPLNEIRNPERYEKLARTLEAARSHVACFAGEMGVPDIYKNISSDSQITLPRRD